MRSGVGQIADGSPCAGTSLTGAVGSRTVSAPAALAGIVAASALVRGWISLGAASPWVLPDELVYSDLSRSIAAGERPAVRGVPVFGWGEVYPTLIAPAWAFVEDRYVAYHVALVVGALVMSLAAVPAYHLTRMFVSRSSSLLVAALTVLVPSLSYTGALLTENAFYPLFVLALLTIARALRRPTIGAQALALVALVALSFTRIQGAAMLAAYAASILTYAATSGFAIGYLRRFAPSALVAVPVALAPFAVSAARGEGPFAWLGQRSGTFDQLHASEIPQWFVLLTVGLVLYVAVAPAVTTAIVAGSGLSRRADEQVRLFTALALPAFTTMLLGIAFVSASSDVDGVGNLNERYVFYVAPLAFVGMALWVERGLCRPRPWAWIALGAACVAPALLPIGRLDYNAGLQALALVPWGALSLSDVGVALVIGAITTSFGVVWLTCSARTSWRLWALVGAWMLVLGLFVVESNRVSASRTAEAFAGLPATWVDDALPAGADVTAVWDENRARRGLPDSFYFWLMVTEFFNRGVGDVYRLGPPTYYEDFLPTLAAGVGPGRTLVDRHGRPVEAQYVLVTCRTPVPGRVVAEAPRGALQLVRVAGPVRLAARGRCARAQP